MPSLIVVSPVAVLAKISEIWLKLLHLTGREGPPNWPSTLSRVLRAVGYTNKRVPKHFHRRRAHRQRKPAQEIRCVPIKCIVTMVEVHKVGSTCYRQYGWVLRGVRDEGIVSEPRKSPRYSAMAAVSIDGVFEGMKCAVPPSYAALVYALFLQALAPSMGKWNPDLPTK